MLLIWFLSCLARFSGVEGYQPRFTSIPSKPTLSVSDNNVTFIWRYHASHDDKTHRFRWLVFGLWTDGDISTPLMSLSKNGSLVYYSDRIMWLGNKTTAAFQLHRVTVQDGGTYGLMMKFGAWILGDSVKLTVLASPRIKKNKSKLEEVKVSEGQSVVIPCHVTGNPQPWISWSRDGRTLQNSTTHSALLIPAANGNMTGLYTCVAGNQAGTDEYHVLLLVTSCEHVKYHKKEDSDQTRSHALENFHERATFTPTLVVAFVLFIIFGAYFFFRCAGSRSKKIREYDRMSQDEQARSLMGEWSNFADSGEKI